MKNKYFVFSILLIVLFVSGCVTNTTPSPIPSTGPDEQEPTESVDYQVLYVKNNNQICLMDIDTKMEQVIYQSDSTIEIIIPNPTMQVVAFATQGDDQSEGKLYIFDQLQNKTYEIKQLETPMPLISWSPDGCNLLLYEATYIWGNATIYDFVNNEIIGEINNIGEPHWNADSNRILANIPIDIAVNSFSENQYSSIIVYDVKEGSANTILEADNDSMYWPIKWLGTDVFAYAENKLDESGEILYQLDLSNNEKTDITEQAEEIIFPKEDIPDSFYDYQYHEFTLDNRYALLCYVDEIDSYIELWDSDTDEVSKLADGYCAFWVNWMS